MSERVHMGPEEVKFMALMENDIREAVSRAMRRFLECQLRSCWPRGEVMGGTAIPAKWREM